MLSFTQAYSQTNSKTKNMNKIVINGTTIQSSGNIVVTNGKIFVGGKDVTPNAKQISIVVTGNVEKIEAEQ
jgi:hypothetical protein